MEKITLKNRKGQYIVGILNKPDGSLKGTCVVQHGWSGKKEQAHIIVMQNAFLKNGFQTFNFDTTNSFNESDGEYSKSRLGLHYEDFEDVVKWVQQQDWFIGPLALTGHSMGGYSAARYAEDYPKEVGLIAPIAPVVSGGLRKEAYLKFNHEDLEKWEKNGVLVKESGTTPGLIKESPYDAFLEMQDHDLLPNAHKLTMPVFLLTGTKDTSIPPQHVQKLFDAIPGENKVFEVIEDAPHTYTKTEHLHELEDKLENWISRVC